MKKTIISIHLCLIFFALAAHFLYGMVVREPYPSFIMPGFSRIDQNTNWYKISDYIIELEHKDVKIEMKIEDLDQPFSKIAISRTFDLVFFTSEKEELYNSSQKKYYAIVKNILGEKKYKQLVTNTRYPTLSIENVSAFKEWVIQRSSYSEKKDIYKFRVVKNEYKYEFKTNKLISKKIINEYLF